MEKVLIDRFVVPEESRAEFLNAVRSSAEYIKTMPGFVEGFVYERIEGESPDNVVTTAVWASEEAFAAAKKTVAEEFKRRGFNPQEIMRSLRVTMQRAVYERRSY